MYQGCIFMDNKRPAGRGYGYVAVSRFMFRHTCFIFGKLRRTDFLPVGPELETEVLERGYLSMDSDEEEHGEYDWGLRETAYDMVDELPSAVVADGNELDDVDFQ